MQITNRRIAVLAAFLLVTVGASCGSDSKTATSTSAAGKATTATTAGASSDSAAGNTAAGTAGSSAGGDDRKTIVDFTVTALTDGGFDPDPDCVAGIVDKLSDADVAQLLPSLAADAPAPELSAEGDALGKTILDSCLVGSDNQELIDQVINKLLTEGNSGIDEECIRTNVAKLNDKQLQLVLDSQTGSTGPESTDPQLQNTAFFLLDCVTSGSTDTTTG